MDEITMACVVDILAFLEVGQVIQPTSVLHEQLRDNMLANGYISKEYLEKEKQRVIDEINES